MSRVIIFGTGQLAEVAFYYITNDTEHEVVAFTVDRAFIEQNSFHGVRVVAYDELLDEYPPSEYKMFVPISYKELNRLRAERFYDVKSKGYECISYVSSKATYYNTFVGENCFILENNVIQPFTKIGDNCILWSGNHVGHHTEIGSHCFIASHAVISGSVKLGDYCFVGVNATIRDNISIGNECVIGAGALLLKNAENKSVFSPKSTKASVVTSDRLRSI